MAVRGLVLGPFSRVYSVPGGYRLAAASPLHPYDPPAAILRETVRVYRDGEGNFYLVYVGERVEDVLPFANRLPKDAEEVDRLVAGGRLVWRKPSSHIEVELVEKDPVRAVLESGAVGERNFVQVMEAIARWDGFTMEYYAETAKVIAEEGFMCCRVRLVEGFTIERGGVKARYAVLAVGFGNVSFKTFDALRGARQFFNRVVAVLEPLRPKLFNPAEYAGEIAARIPGWADAAVVKAFTRDTVVAFPAKRSKYGEGYYYTPGWRSIWKCRCDARSLKNTVIVVTRDGEILRARERAGWRYNTVEPVTEERENKVSTV